MKSWIAAIAIAVLLSYLSGVRVHPGSQPMLTFQKSDAIVPLLHDYIVRMTGGGRAQQSSAAQKKLPGPGIALRPRTPDPNAPPPPAKGTVAYMLSKQGAQDYARQLASDMDQIPRNPFVEAARAAEQKKKS